MIKVNIIMLFHPHDDKMLMCLRLRNPYQGKYNCIGGHVNPGESPIDAAYREMHEETGYTREDVALYPVTTMIYHHSDIELQVYAGRLVTDQEPYGDENPLLWMPLSENFFDRSRFAGDGNIGHSLIEASYMPQFSFLKPYFVP